MRKSNIRIGIILPILLGFIAYGCINDYPVGPPSYPYQPYNPYPNNGNNNSNTQQTIEFRNSNGFSGHLNQGTYLNIPANAFVNNNGQVIDGHIYLTINEIYKKSDMFLSAISTVSDTSLLQSGGMLYLSATQNNTTVSLKSGVHILASFPVNGTPLNMQVFNGASSSNGFTSWKLNADTVNNYIVLKKDSTGKAGYYYNMYSSGLNWLNCDHFNTQTPTTTVKVSVANSSLFSGMTCALVYQVNSETMMNPDTGKYNFMITGSPVGLKATIVVFAQKNYANYAAFVPVTITSNMLQTVTLSQMDENTFKSKLRALD